MFFFICVFLTIVTHHIVAFVLHNHFVLMILIRCETSTIASSVQDRFLIVTQLFLHSCFLFTLEIKVYYHNCGKVGLNNLKQLINDLERTVHIYDAIVLVETGFNRLSHIELGTLKKSIKFHQLFINNFKHGTALFLKTSAFDNIECTEISKTDDTLIVECTKNHKKIALIATYNPQCGESKRFFFNKFLAKLDREVLWCGSDNTFIFADLNFHFTYKNNEVVDTNPLFHAPLVDFMNKHDFGQFNNIPNEFGNVIDVCFAPKAKKIKISVVTEECESILFKKIERCHRKYSYEIEI